MPQEDATTQNSFSSQALNRIKHNFMSMKLFCNFFLANRN